MFAAIGPVDGESGAVVVGGEVVLGHAPGGGADGMDFRSSGFDAGRVSEVEGPEGEVHDVAGHVAEGACSVVPEASPVGGVDVGGVGVVGGWAEEEVPIEVGWDGIFGGFVASVGPAFVAPVIDGGDFADGLGLDEFDDSAVVVSGVDLGSHLCGDADLVGFVGDRAGFVDGVGEGFFAVDRFLEVESTHGGGGVVVVGGGDDDGVEVGCFFVEHLAVVAVVSRLGMNLGGFVEHVGIDVAEDGDVFVGQLLDVVPAFVAAADDGEIEFFIGGLGGAGGEAGDVEGGSESGCCLEEVTTCGVGVRHGWAFARA